MAEIRQPGWLAQQLPTGSEVKLDHTKEFGNVKILCNLVLVSALVFTFPEDVAWSHVRLLPYIMIRLCVPSGS